MRDFVIKINPHKTKTTLKTFQIPLDIKKKDSILSKF